MANLVARSARLDPAIVRGGTMSGYQIRLVQKEPAWASSLVLAPTSLKRLFGSHDQLIATPNRATVLSLPDNTPVPIAADIVVDFEAASASPLMIDAFFIRDGEVGWIGALDATDGVA
jgi:hypothetical protein